MDKIAEKKQEIASDKGTSDKAEKAKVSNVRVMFSNVNIKV